MFFFNENRYIFPSRLALDTVANEVFKKQIKHFCVLPNPIPLHFFDTVPKKKTSGHIGVIGRWTYIKNPHFIEKFAAYNIRYIKNFTIHLITDIGALARLPARILDIVKIVRPMDNRKLSQFYSKMSLIISPSHLETYGNVAQEAIASGTPALITPAMGVAETFRRFGLNDWIVDFSSPARASKSIESALGQSVAKSVR